MRLLYGVGYTDMCAFRAIRRDALAALDLREMTYGWNLEMQMKAAHAGLRIARDSRPLPPPCRRQIQSRGHGGGDAQGWLAHRGHVRPRGRRLSRRWPVTQSYAEIVAMEAVGRGGALWLKAEWGRIAGQT